MSNEHIQNTNRQAYRGSTILGKGLTLSTDTWETGLNNNMLVLGSSGAGKTRNVVKPNLMQMHGSYVVLDTKGQLYKEVGPLLAENGYAVDCLDFTDMSGTVGYDPLANIRRENSRYSQQDVLAIAAALCPEEAHAKEPFWAMAAAKLIASYIAYVLEVMPEGRQTMAEMLDVADAAANPANKASMEKAFTLLGRSDDRSLAARLYREFKASADADRMTASIFGIAHTHLLAFSFDKARDVYRRQPQVDFASLGRSKHALFVTVDDLDHSLMPMVSLFITQAFQSLCNFADKRCPGGRLPVPVHFFLDDFANLNLRDIDNVLSVIRSREISATIICQTISQLNALYGSDKAHSIIGNCAAQVVLSFQDEATAKYFCNRANRTANTLYKTPRDKAWVFLANRDGQEIERFNIEDHPAYVRVAQLERPAGQAAPDYR